MAKWRIVSEAAVEMGIFDGETPDEALDAMARDAGYKDQAEAEALVGPFTGLVFMVVSAQGARRRRYSVEIVECRVDGRRWSRNVLARDESEAVDVAIVRLWGRDASLWPDSGITGGAYGQIVTPCRTGGSSCETDRVRVDVTRGWAS